MDAEDCNQSRMKRIWKKGWWVEIHLRQWFHSQTCNQEEMLHKTTSKNKYLHGYRFEKGEYNIWDASMCYCLKITENGPLIYYTIKNNPNNSSSNPLHILIQHLLNINSTSSQCYRCDIAWEINIKTESSWASVIFGFVGRRRKSPKKVEKVVMKPHNSPPVWKLHAISC